MSSDNVLFCCWLELLVHVAMWHSKSLCHVHVDFDWWWFLTSIYPNWTNKNCFHFFLCPLLKNPRWPPLIRKKAGFRYIFTNKDQKNTSSMSFVVSNPWEWSEYHISMIKIKIILNYGPNCIKITINSYKHYWGYISSGIISFCRSVSQQWDEMLTVNKQGHTIYVTAYMGINPNQSKMRGQAYANVCLYSTFKSIFFSACFYIICLCAELVSVG